MSSMKQVMVLAGLWGGVIAPAARADGVLYGLEKDSHYRRDHCVGPCNCMPWFEEGPLTGTFMLTFDHDDPLYSYYKVSEIGWHVDGDHGAIDLGGDGAYQFGGEVAVTQRMALTLNDWVLEPDAVDSGSVPVEVSFPEIRITVRSSDMVCTQATIDIHAAPVGDACYADCDGNGALDLFDFLCFVNAFNAGEGYADCDGSGGLDLFDFLCFQNEFIDGC